MTGQGTLFPELELEGPAAEIPGQAAMFDDAGEPLPLLEQARRMNVDPALIEAAEHELATNRQRELCAARHVDVIEHRRECGNCIPGHLCREGKRTERELRQARTLLSAMEAGEI